MESLRYTSSAIMFYWGIDRQYLQLETHNMFLAQDFKGSFDDIFSKHQLPEEPSFYVNVPSRVDASAAPAGHDTLMVLVPCGCMKEPSRQDMSGRANNEENNEAAQAQWAAEVARARKTVLARLLRDKGIADLGEHLKFERVYTPHDWAERFNLERGSCFGLSHTFLQLGFLRPHNQHAEYQNLFFAGCSTHPGSGLPNVLLSARLCVERLLMHSAGYSTHSPLGPKSILAGLCWLIFVSILALTQYPLSYFGFHCLFTCPPLSILAYRLRVRILREQQALEMERGPLPQVTMSLVLQLSIFVLELCPFLFLEMEHGPLSQVTMGFLLQTMYLQLCMYLCMYV